MSEVMGNFLFLVNCECNIVSNITTQKDPGASCHKKCEHNKHVYLCEWRVSGKSVNEDEIQASLFWIISFHDNNVSQLKCQTGR